MEEAKSPVTDAATLPEGYDYVGGLSFEGYGLLGAVRA
jgi:hypothetical protein